MSDENSAGYALANPFGKEDDLEFVVPGQIGYQPGLYEQTLAAGYALQQRPRRAAGVVNIERQHEKDRMTIWERIKVLADGEPTVLFQNWGKNLDGASLVTAIIKIEGPRRRDLRPRLHRARRLHGRHQRPQARPPDLPRRQARHPADRA